MYSVSRTNAGKSTAASSSVVFILVHLLHALATIQIIANGSVSIKAIIKQHTVIRAASLFLQESLCMRFLSRVPKPAALGYFFRTFSSSFIVTE